MPASRSKKPRTTAPRRVLNARPDTLDFRDKMYQATLIEVPPRRSLESYLEFEVPILDQGQEGACTGFGLATVVHYLCRCRKVDPDKVPISPRMLYEMAKRYDEWPGEDYEGSSARGAMKGWHKHGVCNDELWRYDVRRKDNRLTPERIADAVRRPLGAYYRVNHKDLVAMHSALSEVGILYATASVHEGWDAVKRNGIIPFPGNYTGGHAFAIVAYDERGFWIQNSWGSDWGMNGFALISYDDWLENGTDVWVARLGAPVTLQTAAAAAVGHSAAARQSRAYTFVDLAPHIISLGNNGALRTSGTYGTSEEDVEQLLTQSIPAAMAGWRKKRLLIYAHGGLVSENNAVQRVADYRAALLDHEVYPLALIWKTDFWTTLTNILKDAISRQRPEGLLDAAKDFMLDRLDDALEPLARRLTGKSQWDEMKENALLASTSKQGGVRIMLKHLTTLLDQHPDIELHIAGHSAGSIIHAPLVQMLASRGKITAGPLRGETGLGRTIASCTLWAPACTMELFHETYRPLLESGRIEQFALFTLTDVAEQHDNCGRIYNKSLLYLVSNAFEEKPRIPLFRDGVPLLGMEKFVNADEALMKLIKAKRIDWVLSPNLAPDGNVDSSTSRAHGDFDDDGPTVRATLARILKRRQSATAFSFQRSNSSLRDQRRNAQQLQ